MQFKPIPVLILFPLVFSSVYSIGVRASESVRPAVANINKIYYLGTVTHTLFNL